MAKTKPQKTNGEMTEPTVIPVGIPGVEASAAASTYTPSSLWDQREQWITDAEDSKRLWRSLSKDEKRALFLSVQNACIRAASRVDDWLPEGLTGAGGECIDVTFKVMLTDASEAIQKHTAGKLKLVSEAEADLLRKGLAAHKREIDKEISALSRSLVDPAYVVEGGNTYS